jgi:hypothetical protein
MAPFNTNTSTMLLAALVLGLLSAPVFGDIYMHNMRGSNNRLDERNRDRNNANRLFDSQNNNRGGYNVGSLYFYEGEKLSLSWTNQHSCGSDHADCQIVFQYMCDSRLRDGVTTRTIPRQPSNCQNKDCNNDVRYGMHEDFDYYMNCRYRFRNRGLFTADRNLNGNTARFTRQNNNGQRRGYECPEERDHYPYWHPTPWIDMHIYTNDARRCEFYQTHSENVMGRNFCAIPNEWYHHMISRGGNGNNGFIPNTMALCNNLNNEGSQMHTFLRQRAAQAFQSAAERAREEQLMCEQAQLECGELVDETALYNACKAKFDDLSITADQFKTEVEAKCSICEAGEVEHPFANCRTCIPTACASSMVPRNVSEPCPAPLVQDETNMAMCVPAACTGQTRVLDSTKLAAIDKCIAEQVMMRGTEQRYLIESDSEEICVNRVTLSASCYTSNIPKSEWSFKPAHNETYPWLKAPTCQQSPWVRPNSLGNGVGGFELSYNYSIPPHFHEHCALRIRYNITTSDYNGLDPHDAGQVNSTLNKRNGNNPAKVNIRESFGLDMSNSDRPYENDRGYLFKQNPQVEIFDFDKVVRYCDHSGLAVEGDMTKCKTSTAPTAGTTAAKTTTCPHTHPFVVTTADTVDGETVRRAKPDTCCKSAVGDKSIPSEMCCDGDVAADPGCQMPALTTNTDFKLQLAINTNQFGRTFQDRTHSFAMRERSEELKEQCDTIHALNVRGKRGNIVQTFPGTEYDFTPMRLHVSEGDCVHIAWTGSNTNPNNNDGQGKRGTDRHNMIELETFRGEGARGVQSYGGKGAGGTTWTTKDMEPGYENWRVNYMNKAPTMMDPACPSAKDGTGAPVYPHPHPFDWTKCSSCSLGMAGNWIQRVCTETESTDGSAPVVTCSTACTGEYVVDPVNVRYCTKAACATLVDRPKHTFAWFDLATGERRDFGVNQIGVMDSLKKGQWGMSHPEHLDNSTFLGLSREDLENLAVLNNVQFRGEMSELDDAGTFYDLPPRKVTGVGIYKYMCSRNNNFSNRSQKGMIVVSEAKETGETIGEAGGVVAMRLAETYSQLPQGMEALAEDSDVSVVVPPKSIRAATPVTIEMIPASGQGSDVLAIGPDTLFTAATVQDFQLTPPGAGRRRADSDVWSSLVIKSPTEVWFWVRGATLEQWARKEAEKNPENVISARVVLKSSGGTVFYSEDVRINGAWEIEGTASGLSPAAIRAVESGDIWLDVTTIDTTQDTPVTTSWLGNAPVEPETGGCLKITMPASVTAVSGKLYRYPMGVVGLRCATEGSSDAGCIAMREEVGGATVKNGQATACVGGSAVAASSGYYSVSEGTNLPLILGITVGAVVIALAALGAAIYFRKHEDRWEAAKEWPGQKLKNFSRSFATRV